MDEWYMYVTNVYMCHEFIYVWVYMWLGQTNEMNYVYIMSGYGWVVASEFVVFNTPPQPLAHWDTCLVDLVVGLQNAFRKLDVRLA